jgi:hypothetical protein
MDRKSLTVKKRNSSGRKRVTSEMTMINPDVVGIDLGSGEHCVCVPADRTKENVQRFGVYIADFCELAKFLVSRKKRGRASEDVYI